MARQKAQQDEPAFYVAKRDILISHPDSGQMPVAAYRQGDRLEPDVVESNGWHDLVARPDEELPDDDDPGTPPQYQTTAGPNQVVTDAGTPAEGGE